MLRDHVINFEFPKNFKMTLLRLTTIIGFIALAATAAGAQEPPEQDLNWHFQQGMQALGDGDENAYLEHFKQVVALMPEGDINRPFVQYHLARAYAMAGDALNAGRLLGMMFDENIESLMIYYATLDPAFDSVRASTEYEAAMARVEELEIGVTHVAGNVFMLQGAGCNIAASIGPDGVLLVDIGYAPAAPAVRRALAQRGAETVHYIVNTHQHEDHVGGNDAFGSAVAILAHDQTREAMLEPQVFIEGVVVPPKPAGALPTITFSGGPISVYFNGEEIRIIPLPAHTEGDALVHFVGSNVLHMGDRYFPGARRHVFPGSDVRGYQATMDDLLAEIPSETLVMAGHDPVHPISDLKDAHAATLEAIEFIEMAIADGKPLEEIQSEGSSLGLSAGWIAVVYRGLSGEDGGD